MRLFAQIASAGVDAGVVTNDFDTAAIYSEFTDVTDADGNEFRGIPKLYIRKTDTSSFKSWQISKAKMPGSYCPYDFYNFSTGTWNDYVYIGKYPSGIDGGGTKLTSVANIYPLIDKTIVENRAYAEAVGTGYQQLDIHMLDMLQVLFLIEFATLDSQAIMAGWSAGNYLAADQLTADTSAANTMVVSNITGAKFAVGQPVSVGAVLGTANIIDGRNITLIQADTPAPGSTTITVDGAAFNASATAVIWNCRWKNGFSSGIAASSGSIAHNTNGKNPMVYRGIENLYGNLYQFVDGYNINNNQGWYCKNAESYESNVFESPYIQLSYVNKNANGYVKYMGFDSSNPMVELPIDVSSSLYKDYYFQLSGQRTLIFGGRWNNTDSVGLFYHAPFLTSIEHNIGVCARLCLKADHETNLTIIGDSISNEATEWPYYLQDLYPILYIDNYAEGGATIITDGDADADMDAQVVSAASDNADIIIIALGTNDDNAGNMATLQAEFEENIAELKTSNTNATIYVMNLLKRWVNNTDGAEVDKSNIRTAIAAACTAQAVTCWDTYTTSWIAQSETTDGLHPDATGHAKIAAAVLARLP